MPLRFSADKDSALVFVLFAGLFFYAGCGTEKSESKSESSTNKSESEAWSKSKSDAEGTVYKSDGSDGTKSTKTPDRDLSKVKPDFTVQATEFAAEYKKDGKAAEAKYKGKVVEVSGRVIGFGQNIERTHYLELYGKGILTKVLCLTKMKNPWFKASPGQTVTLRGVWPPSPFTLTLINCHITEVTGDSCPKLTAEQVAAAYESDAKKAKAYRDAPACFLEGVISKKETKKNGLVTVDLKHAGKCKVSCTFPADAKEQTKSLTVGQSIQVIGQTKFSDSDETNFSLVFCVLIEK